jgi:hypothetical protein
MFFRTTREAAFALKAGGERWRESLAMGCRNREHTSKGAHTRSVFLTVPWGLLCNWALAGKNPRCWSRLGWNADTGAAASNRNSRDPESPDVVHTVEERCDVRDASNELQRRAVDGAGGV